VLLKRAPLPDSSTAEAPTGLRSGSDPESSGGPPAHWVERVRRGAPGLLEPSARRQEPEEPESVPPGDPDVVNDPLQETHASPMTEPRPGTLIPMIGRRDRRRHAREARGSRSPDGPATRRARLQIESPYSQQGASDARSDELGLSDDADIRSPNDRRPLISAPPAGRSQRASLPPAAHEPSAPRRSQIEAATPVSLREQGPPPPASPGPEVPAAGDRVPPPRRPVEPAARPEGASDRLHGSVLEARPHETPTSHLEPIEVRVRGVTSNPLPPSRLSRPASPGSSLRPVPPTERAEEALPWPELDDSAATRARPSVNEDPWPELPSQPPFPTDDSPAVLRTWERLQRLDREQRGD
jgi:hypothetical protein